MLTVNGAAEEWPDGVTVLEVLRRLTGSSRGSAVIVDGEIVARSRWATFALAREQCVEVICAVPGG